jgi:hypothetical protein
VNLRIVILIVLALVALCIGVRAGEQESRAFYMQYERWADGATVTGHGTAFPIAERQLLTAAHNILDDHSRPHATIRVQIGGSWVPAKPIRWHVELDIALLSVEVAVTPLQLAPGDPDEGELLEIVGSMKGTPVATYRGHVHKRWHGATARTLAKVPFDHGLSGAPVLQNGRVIGLAVCGIPKDADLDHNYGLFLPTDIVRWFMKQDRKEPHAKAEK